MAIMMRVDDLAHQDDIEVTSLSSIHLWYAQDATVILLHHCAF